MNSLWIETLSPRGEVLTRQRFNQDEIRIGRGYDNDFMIDECAAASQQLRIIHQAEGAWMAEDYGVTGQTNPQQPMLLDPENIMQIGKTRLRFRPTDYVQSNYALPDNATENPVANSPAEIKLNDTLHGAWKSVLFVSSLLLIASLTQSWLNETRQSEVSHYLLPVLVYAVMMLLWASGWALLSRLFSGQAKFRAHLLTALCGLFAIGLLSTLIATLEFSLGLGGLKTVWEYVSWAAIAAWCYAHLRVMGSTHQALKIGLVSVVAVVIIASQYLLQREQAAKQIQFSPMSSLMPPFLRFVQANNSNQFLEDAQKMKADLDIERKKEPPESGGLFRGL